VTNEPAKRVEYNVTRLGEGLDERLRHWDQLLYRMQDVARVDPIAGIGAWILRQSRVVLTSRDGILTEEPWQASPRDGVIVSSR
jgi:hypothetical protein